MTDSTPPPSRRRRRILLFAVLWSICLITAGWLVHSALQRRQPPQVRPADSTQAGDPRTGDPIAALLQGRPAEPDMLGPQGTAAMKGEPGDLPVPPDTQRLLAYQQTDAGEVVQTAVYQTERTEPLALIRWYESQLEPTPYELVSQKDQADHHNRLYHQPGRRLLLRIARRGRTVRVVVQLRYTMD